MAKPCLRFRPDIQGMRAIAIAIVVLAHAHVPGFEGGFVGVDVFFVLSGYLITGLLVAEQHESGTIRYVTFLARRLRRLLPALFVMLVCVLVAAWSLLSTFEARMQTGSFVYAAMWTSNFYFSFAEFDYFAVLKAKDIFLHTWSLGLEEQFYVIWPWLIVLSFAVSARFFPTRRTFHTLFLAIAAVLVVGMGLCLYWAHTDPLLSFYMMPARGWQFALGAGVFILSGRTERRGLRARSFESIPFKRAMGLLGLMLVGGSAVCLNGSLNYPGGYALFPSVGTAMLIYSGSGSDTPITRLLGSRGFVWLGDRSYSLYLWHWPVLLLGGAFGLSGTVVGVSSMCLLAIVLATLSYSFVEIPFWKGRFSAVPPRQVMLTAVLAVAMAAGTSAWVPDLASGSAYDSSTGAGADPRSDAPDIFNVTLSCDSWYFSSAVVPCETGEDNARHTAVLIGDSIGTQWASLLPQIYQAPEWRVIVLAKSACVIADLEYFYKPAGGNYDVCTDWRNNSIDYIAGLNPDIVFIGSSSTGRFTESEWIEGSSRILKRLVASAQRVVLIAGTPALSFDGPSCLREPYRFTRRLRNSRKICEEALHSPISDMVAGYLTEAASNFSNAHVLNLNDLVCPGKRCSARSPGGIPVFRDNQHLTASFVHAMSAEVRERLATAGLGPSHLIASGRTKVATATGHDD